MRVSHRITWEQFLGELQKHYKGEYDTPEGLEGLVLLEDHATELFETGSVTVTLGDVGEGVQKKFEICLTVDRVYY